MNIFIVDYGIGNLSSVKRGFQRIGVETQISSSLTEVEDANKLVLPGVGHFSEGINNIKNLGLWEILSEKVLSEKTPILGICLGMQMMGNKSEEGGTDGLGWINADIKRFKIKDKLRYKVPNIGWNNTKLINKNKLSLDLTDRDYFYFVHSYHMVCNDPRDVWMRSSYESDFVSAINKGNIFGTQFHPEKSHSAGLKILKSFAEF